MFTFKRVRPKTAGVSVRYDVITSIETKLQFVIIKSILDKCAEV